MGEKLTEVLSNLLKWLSTAGVKIVIGFLALFIFFKIINAVFRKVDKKLEAKNFDLTLRKVLVTWLRRIIKFLGVVCLISFLGIETSGIAAAIASIGVTVGLALQGSLSNLAGGVLIIVLRPFKIGDFIEVDGQKGTVENIEIFHTYIRTPENTVVILPNGKTANTTITNFSMKDSRRVDLTFTISYESDYDQAKQILLDLMTNSELILQDPTPFVAITEHGSSSVNILARYWTKNNGDLWASKCFMLEEVKKAFDSNNISIPYPQMDIHIKDNAAK